MKLLTMGRLPVFALALGTLAAASDKPAHTYQKGTITGYENVLHDKNRRTRVYELKGTDHVYQVDLCGAFQAGKFEPGQTVDYRVDGGRLYIVHDSDKEYSCKIEGEKTLESANPAVSTTH